MEQLVTEWLEFRGYFTRGNVFVGRLPKGGFDGEIDIAAFHPITEHCLHVECSGDADSWKVREVRFQKKFAIGRCYIGKEIFPWLKDPKTEQWAVVWAASPERTSVAGGKVVTTKMLYGNIARDVIKDTRGGSIIPEKYPLLRTIRQTVKHVGGLADMAARVAEGPRLLPEYE